MEPMPVQRDPGTAFRFERAVLPTSQDSLEGNIIQTIEHAESCVGERLLVPENARETRVDYERQTKKLEEGVMDICIDSEGPLDESISPNQKDPVILALLSVLSAPDKIKALKELEDHCILDFLHSTALRSPSADPKLREDALDVLRELSATSQLYLGEYCPLENLEQNLSAMDGGSFSNIYQGHFQGQLLCLKVVRPSPREINSRLKVFLQEAVLWAQLDHPNILPFHGVYYLDDEHKRICLVSPWMENGHLRKYLQANPSVPRKPLIYDIASGLQYLHGKDIVHSDLKGDNILVNGLGRACIADFGSSSIHAKELLRPMLMSTLRWTAPELLEEGTNRPNRASDVWALGCVCYEVLTRQLPYCETKRDYQVMPKVKRGKLPVRPEGDKTLEVDRIDDQMWDLMMRCWQIHPGGRPTCQDILEELYDVDCEGFESWSLEAKVSYERVSEEGRLFRCAVKKNSDLDIDLVKIQQILEKI